MLKCMIVQPATLDAFSQQVSAADEVDNREALMRVSNNIQNSLQQQRKSSNDLLTSTRAYLKSCVLGSVIDGSDVTAGNVALDNKIEQAMDLVKSHLMFAVREEVELLKEQIKNLIANNTRLEHENAILRQTASPETLAKLQAPPPAAPATAQSRDVA